MQHKNLASGRWQKLSLFEQLGNIGSEVYRTLQNQDKDESASKAAAFRALELLDLTLEDPRWKTRQKEIARAREVFCDTVFGSGEYKTSLKDLQKYFDEFAYAARLLHK